MKCDGKLVVDVDLPAPFSYMPKVVTTAGGNLTIQTMLNSLATQFTKSFVRDYEAWAASQQLRAQREAMYWSYAEAEAEVQVCFCARERESVCV
jgi:hypothetical protein